MEDLHRVAKLPVGGECTPEVEADARPLLRGAGEFPGPPQMRVEVLASTDGGLLEAELVQHRRDLIGRRRLLEGAAQIGDRGVRGTPGVSLACRGPQHAEPLGVTGPGNRQQVAGDAFALRVAARHQRGRLGVQLLTLQGRDLRVDHPRTTGWTKSSSRSAVIMPIEASASAAALACARGRPVRPSTSSSETGGPRTATARATSPAGSSRARSRRRSARPPARSRRRALGRRPPRCQSPARRSPR